VTVKTVKKYMFCYNFIDQTVLDFFFFFM